MARALTPQDCYALINAISAEITGQQPTLQAVDTSSFVSVGESILSYGTENTINAIAIVLGRTFMAVRPYEAKLKILNTMNSSLYSNRMRKISFLSRWAEPSGAFNTNLYTNHAMDYDNGNNSGNSLPTMWEQNQPVPLELNFGGSSVWDDSTTIYEKQLQVAFRDENEFAAFMGAIMTEKGNENEALIAANRFFDWMRENYGDHIYDIKLKVLEFVLRAEHIAIAESGMEYHFLSRQDYLTSLLALNTMDEIQQWFINKIASACRDVVSSKEKQGSSSVERAKAYIAERYNKDISLDDVSREMDISPYYFSKLFKEETGENFIEYLTSIRINKAKQLISGTDMSMKEICTEVGYADPNYFSRIFKKNVGVTPTEYKEKQ